MISQTRTSLVGSSRDVSKSQHMDGIDRRECKRKSGAPELVSARVQDQGASILQVSNAVSVCPCVYRFDLGDASRLHESREKELSFLPLFLPSLSSDEDSKDWTVSASSRYSVSQCTNVIEQGV